MSEIKAQHVQTFHRHVYQFFLSLRDSGHTSHVSQSTEHGRTGVGVCFGGTTGGLEGVAAGTAFGLGVGTAVA